jgi:RNA-directed DNA polymerase
MQAKLQEIKKELRERMHQPIPKQGQCLKQIVTGYFHYHAVPTNSRALARFRHHIAISGFACSGGAARETDSRGNK